MTHSHPQFMLKNTEGPHYIFISKSWYQYNYAATIARSKSLRGCMQCIQRTS